MGGLIVGMNASQIDGDQAGGFNKVGLVAGIRGGFYLSEKSMITIDMLYSQRGSQRKPNPKLGDNFAPYSINTPYIEVPLLFHFKDWKQEYEDGSSYHRVSAEAGLAFGYLINPTVTNYHYDKEIQNFNKIDIGWTIGVSFYFNEHIGFSSRFQRSLTPLYNNQKYVKNFERLLGYHFNFGVFYVI